MAARKPQDTSAFGAAQSVSRLLGNLHSKRERRQAVELAGAPDPVFAAAAAIKKRIAGKTDEEIARIAKALHAIIDVEADADDE